MSTRGIASSARISNSVSGIAAPDRPAVERDRIAVGMSEHAEIRRAEGLQPQGRRSWSPPARHGSRRSAAPARPCREPRDWRQRGSRSRGSGQHRSTARWTAAARRPAPPANRIFSVRLRKYAVSSSVAVPWPMTMPARSGMFAGQLLAEQRQRLPVGEIDRGARHVPVADRHAHRRPARFRATVR